jgi:hypothetical protein
MAIIGELAYFGFADQMIEDSERSGQSRSDSARHILRNIIERGDNPLVDSWNPEAEYEPHKMLVPTFLGSTFQITPFGKGLEAIHGAMKWTSRERIPVPRMAGSGSVVPSKPPLTIFQPYRGPPAGRWSLPLSDFRHDPKGALKYFDAYFIRQLGQSAVDVPLPKGAASTNRY